MPLSPAAHPWLLGGIRTIIMPSSFNLAAVALFIPCLALAQSTVCESCIEDSSLHPRGEAPTDCRLLDFFDAYPFARESDDSDSTSESDRAECIGLRVELISIERDHPWSNQMNGILENLASPMGTFRITDSSQSPGESIRVLFTSGRGEEYAAYLAERIDRLRDSEFFGVTVVVSPSNLQRSSAEVLHDADVQITIGRTWESFGVRGTQ